MQDKASPNIKIDPLDNKTRPDEINPLKEEINFATGCEK